MGIQKRLKLLASFVPKGNTVYDIGCDHALLSIYLTLYNANTCYAIDNKEKVLKTARENISHYHLEGKIFVLRQDGLGTLSIEEESTAVLAGMGTDTILHILENKEMYHFHRLIIQTNNDYERLRKSMQKKGYKIKEEVAFLDKRVFYVILVFEKGHVHYSKYDLKFGPLLRKQKTKDRDLYYQYLIEQKEEILKKLPRGYLGKKIKLRQEILWLRRKI